MKISLYKDNGYQSYSNCFNTSKKTEILINKKQFFGLLAASLVSSFVFAVDVTVNPSTGVAGNNPTDTIADALVQIAAGADAVNTITLTDAAHVLEADAIWDIPAGKTVNFVAEANRPVIRLTGGSNRFNLRVYIPATATLNMTGVALIPESGQSYANNVNDGIITWADNTEDFNIPSGTMTFTDVIFGANDGSDGVAPLSQHADYAGNIFGDDIIQFGSGGIVTFDGCLLTGAGDDAILFDGDGFDAATTPAELNLINGTAIIENGGAGIQMFGGETAVNLDGSGGRILIVNNGQRDGTSDSGIKNFSTNQFSLSLIDTDIVGNTIGGILEYGRTATFSFVGSRIANNNGNDVFGGANFAYIPGSGDPTDPITITIDNSTFHDCLGVTGDPTSAIANIEWGDGFATPTWEITDSIFSGVNDIFDLLNGTDGTVNISNSAVVTSGPDAVGDVGDLAAATINADPGYNSTVLSDATPAAENINFLAPSVELFSTAAGDGGFIGAVAAQIPTYAEIWTRFQ